MEALPLSGGGFGRGSSLRSGSATGCAKGANVCKRSVTGILLGLAALASCQEESSPDVSGTRGPGVDSVPAVYVVNYPLRYFAERIGGERIDVRFPAPPDVDPAYWRPDEEAIASYQQGDLILLNGAEYAKWVEYVSLPAWTVVDTSAALRDEYISIEDTVTHAHGPQGEHADGGVAFTTWLDPTLAVEQARAIKAAFVKAWPQYSQDFEAGFTSLVDDLRTIDDELEQIASALADRPIVASHPVYQYLARRYDLEIESLHWEPDQPLTEAMTRELEAILSRHPAEMMIWEGQPRAATADALAGRGLRSVVFDPCGNTPETGDYLETMKANIRNLRAAYSE